MNAKPILIVGSLGLLAWTALKSKAQAWDKVKISFKKFSIQGFEGLDLDSKLTVSLNNPTGTALAFSSIEGTISDTDGHKISTFSNQVGAKIEPNTVTNVDVIIKINVVKLAQSVLELISSGFKKSILIDSITNVGGIKIPVRQVFDVDFSQIKNELITSLSPGQEAARFDLPAPAPKETPTIAQPEIFTHTHTPEGFISANAVGDIDPTGGVVITLPPPGGINPDQFTDVKTENGYVMVLPGNIATYNFNASTGYTIGKKRK